MRNIKCRNCAKLRNDWCDKKKDSPDLDLVRDCHHYRTRTNRDALRQMTDEELAEYLASVANDGGGSCAPGCHDCSTHNCKDSWLAWLQSEATDDA